MEVQNQSNLTEIDLSWIDPWKVANDQNASKIALGMFHVWNSIISTLLYVGFMDYERFGGDPQKRGINNQLSYHYAATQVFFHWMLIPILFYRTIFGPLHKWVIAIQLFIYPLRFVWQTFIGIEIFVYKYMAIVIAKRVLPIVDDFFGTYFFFANMVIGLVAAIAYNFTQDSYEMQSAFSGYPRVIVTKSPIGNDFLAWVFVAHVLIIGYTNVKTVIARRKMKNELQEGPQVVANGNNGINTVRHNKDVATIGMWSAIGVCSALIVIGLQYLMTRSQILTIVIDTSAWMLGLPILVYSFKKDLRDHALEFYGIR